MPVFWGQTCRFFFIRNSRLIGHKFIIIKKDRDNLSPQHSAVFILYLLENKINELVESLKSNANNLAKIQRRLCTLVWGQPQLLDLPQSYDNAVIPTPSPLKCVEYSALPQEQTYDFSDFCCRPCFIDGVFLTHIGCAVEHSNYTRSFCGTWLEICCSLVKTTNAENLRQILCGVR